MVEIICAVLAVGSAGFVFLFVCAPLLQDGWEGWAAAIGAALAVIYVVNVVLA